MKFDGRFAYLFFRQTRNFLIKGACCLPKQPYLPFSFFHYFFLEIFQTKLIVPPFEISNKCDHLDCDLVFIMHAVNIIPFHSVSSLKVPIFSKFLQLFKLCLFNFGSVILPIQHCDIETFALFNPDKSISILRPKLFLQNVQNLPNDLLFCIV